MESHQKQIENINTTEGFERAFREYYAALCSYVYGFLKENEAAEEVVQDLFFKLWQKRNSIEIQGSVKSYLYRAVRNESLNVIKHIKIRENYKEHNERERNAQEELTSNELESNETMDRVTGAISRMPEQRQLIFRMSRFESLKYREIADELNLSIKTVENQMGKALAFLRKELTDIIPTLLILIQILTLQ